MVSTYSSPTHVGSIFPPKIRRSSRLSRRPEASRRFGRTDSLGRRPQRTASFSCSYSPAGKDRTADSSIREIKVVAVLQLSSRSKTTAVAITRGRTHETVSIPNSCAGWTRGMSRTKRQLEVIWNANAITSFSLAPSVGQRLTYRKLPEPHAGSSTFTSASRS